ncbi:hypothetical protein H0O00_00865 [Candidatus Micrarchaeota archaeon]|nr:hypothetical protein [Candidatus Micrarchaeota archaeon]
MTPPRQGIDLAEILAGPPPAVDRAQNLVVKFFRSNATREQLPPALIGQLDEMRKAGHNLLNALEPYQQTSLFRMRNSEERCADLLASGVKEPDEWLSIHTVVAANIRKELDGAQRLMVSMFGSYPQEDKDLQTTSVLSALFFISAVARYGPDIILESIDDAKSKEGLTRSLLAFYERHIKNKLDITQKYEISPRDFHIECFSIYLDFKRAFPELFEQLRQRLWSSKMELMAPYGDKEYADDWQIYHYKGNF